jgi:glyoxylase-like metal-dependent hydrolase (beta-lactamase superfamily II)
MHAPPTIESLAELARFAPDVYGFRYQNYVSLFVVTPDGVLLVDPIGEGNQRTPSMIKEAIRSVTDQPVRFVIYSHSAADHALGGAVFADTAEFVAHSRSAERLAAAKYPDTPVPQTTFEKELSLDLGGKRFKLYAADLSAADDYIVFHAATDRVVMTVDYVQPRNIPFRGLLGHPDWIVPRLQWIYDNLDFDLLVSGHASPQMVGTRQDVAEQRQYYLDLLDAIASARAASLTDNSSELAAAVRSTLAPRYSSWRRFDEFLGLNIEGMLRWREGG